MDGDDLHRLPLSIRKANLARGRPEGIFINPFEQGEIGPDLFRKPCEFGLEGLVSKHRDRLYQSGRSKHWIKVKNRKHHAFERVWKHTDPGSSLTSYASVAIVLIAQVDHPTGSR